MKKILFLIAISFLVFQTIHGQVSEQFDFNFGTSYGDYSNIGENSDFNLINGLYDSNNSRSGGSIRFRNSGSPSLSYVGSDDAGKDGGIGIVSFWYRHWDGDGSTPAFQVEYSTDSGTSWSNIGSETIVTSTEYSEFRESVNLGVDNVIVRIRVTSTAERILIDDFGITDFSASLPNVVLSKTSLNDFKYIKNNGPSTEKSLTVSGSNLQGNIELNISSNYEMSIGTGSNFNASSPITLSQSNGSVSETSIYVRLKSGLNSATYNADLITITSTNIDQKSVSLSGSVIDPFSIPYSNGFRNQTDYDAATSIGFTITSSDQRTSSGGYLKLDNGQYIETPTIDFTQYSYLDIKFYLDDFGGSTGQQFSVLASNNDGSSFEILKTISVPTSNTAYSVLVDLTGSYNVSTGKLQLKMTDGSNSTRFRDLEINEAYVALIKDSPGYRMFSSPVTTTYSTLLDPIWTQGATSADASNGAPNVFTWNNTATGDANSNWIGMTDLSGNITSGEGFLVYVYADDDYDGSDDAFPKTLSVSGTEHAANASPAINSNGDGWTLLGNPFTSTIDFDELTTNDITGTAYVWDPTSGGSGAWKSWSGSAGDLTGGLLAPLQGFFVQTVTSPSGSPSVVFPATAKSSGGTFYGKTSHSISFLRLEVEGESVSNSAWVQFSESGSATEIVDGDALELQPLATHYAQLGIHKGENVMDIAHLHHEQEVTIPIEFNSTEGGTYTIRATDYEIPADMKVVFHDYEQEESITMDDSFEYSFDAEKLKKQSVPSLSMLSAGAIKFKSTNSNRFGLTIRPSSVSNEPDEKPIIFSLDQNYPNPFNPSTTIDYSIENFGLVSIRVYNVMGREVATLVHENKAAGRYTVSWNSTGISSGMYYYRLEANGQAITRKMTLIK